MRLALFAAFALVLVCALCAVAAPVAHAATKGWKISGETLVYVKKNGKRAKDATIDGIRLGHDGKAKTSTASQLKKLCMKRIAKWTDKSQSRSSKLQTCFSHCVTMAFVPSSTPRDIGTSGWVQRCALRTLRTGNTECFGCACSFAMLAFELGYKPVVYGYPGVHAYVVIGKKRWDNMAAQPTVKGAQRWKVKSWSALDPAGTKTSVFKWGQKYNPKGHVGLYRKKGHYYFAKDGKNLTKAWKTVKGKTYYFKADGKAATGPCKVKRKRGAAKQWWVFSAKGALLCGKGTRVVKVAGVKYRVGKSGRAKPGWNESRTRYYLATGQIACGLRLVGGALMSFSNAGAYDAGTSAALQRAAVVGKPAGALLQLLPTPKKTTTSALSCYELPDNPTLGGVDRTRTFSHVAVNTFVGEDGQEYLESIVAL